MVPTPVRHGLNEDRTVLLDGASARLLGNLVACKDVVAVDSHRLDAVPNGTRRNAIAPILIGDGRADRVPVVTAEEENGAIQGRRKVQRWVEIAFRCSAVPKVAYDTAPYPTSPGQSPEGGPGHAMEEGPCLSRFMA